VPAPVHDLPFAGPPWERAAVEREARIAHVAQTLPWILHQAPRDERADARGRRGRQRRKVGSRYSTRDSTSAMSSPAKARFPVSISNSTAPNAQMSARLSTERPLACSGDMYAAVPRIIPA